jgi:hypothetical protein
MLIEFTTTGQAPPEKGCLELLRGQTACFCWNNSVHLSSQFFASRKIRNQYFPSFGYLEGNGFYKKILKKFLAWTLDGMVSNQVIDENTSDQDGTVYICTG